MGAKNIDYQRKVFILFVIAVILLVLAMTASISIGRYPIPPKDIVGILRGKSVNAMTELVFLNLRLPRTIMVLLAGFGLSISGSVYQTIFKNPLATPDIIGVSSGANLGAAIAIAFLVGGSISIALFAFLGGIGAVFFALALTRLSNERGVTNFVLAGIVIGSIAQGFIMLLKSFVDPERQLASIEYWAMGSFAGITLDKLLSILPFYIIGLLGLILLRWEINILSLSDEEGISLGVRVAKVRVAIILSATLVVASIVSVSGLISFIGLIGPHIGRMLTKRNDYRTVALSGMVGAIILLVADCFARSLTSSELPISILTTFIGAPFLAYLMIRIRS